MRSKRNFAELVKSILKCLYLVLMKSVVQKINKKNKKKFCSFILLTQNTLTIARHLRENRSLNVYV